jgi:hypothetical protein
MSGLHLEGAYEAPANNAPMGRPGLVELPSAWKPTGVIAETYLRFLAGLDSESEKDQLLAKRNCPSDMLLPLLAFGTNSASPDKSIWGGRDLRQKLTNSHDVNHSSVSPD